MMAYRRRPLSCAVNLAMIPRVPLRRQNHRVANDFNTGGSQKESVRIGFFLAEYALETLVSRVDRLRAILLMLAEVVSR